jgi:hypothetical protein
MGGKPIDISRYYYIIKPDEEIYIDNTDIDTVYDDRIRSE